MKVKHLNKEEVFLKILLDGAITTVFQPIVSLKNGEVFAYEALSRISVPACEINIEELFQIAHRQDKLWELEKLSRTRALQNAANGLAGSVLFLNVDAGTIHDPEFRSGFTAQKLLQYGIRPDHVVIELTEKSAIHDLDGFVFIVRHYQSQGFEIAIDDFGSGYSGLGRVCALSPRYLKLDMSLIRHIDKDAVKRSAVSSTVEFCRQSGISVIAEGIENEEELAAVIRLGVDYGQGYHLAQPNSVFQELSPACRHQICALYDRTMLRYRPSVFGQIGELGETGATAQQNEPSLSLYKQFKKVPEMAEAFILDEQEHICGILTRQHIFEKYGGEFGYNLSRRMSTGSMMLTEVLAVDEQTSIDQVAGLAMQRSYDRVYDAVAVTRDGKYLRTVTVRELLLASIQLQVQRATDANPLTGLPGNQEIQRVIRQTYRKVVPWAIVYFDLDNFKAYNDAYGFTNGDLMLKALADTLCSCVGGDAFLGHVGGDDFVMVALTHTVEPLCQAIIVTFHDAIEQLYTPVDWAQGFILSKDRSGFPRQYPIATLSISVLTNHERQISSMEELAAEIAQIKKECKQQKGDTILVR